MTDLFGNYQSQSTRQLTRIDSTKYPDTNEDFEANLRRLNSFVDYISQYLQQMQKGVDQAAQDPITRMRDTITNLGVLFGGGELLYGIDLGDLQYFLPALGAMFGFDSSTPFPINLFEAVEHFFLGYIIPLDSWNVAVEGIIDGWMVALGLNDDFIAAVHLLLDNMGRFTGDLMSLFKAATDLLGVFNIFDFVNGPIGPIWSSLSSLLSNFNIANLGAITDPFLETLTPWIQALGEILGVVDDFIEAFSGGLDSSGLGGLSNISNWLDDFLGMFGGFVGLGSGTPSILNPSNIPILGPILGLFSGGANSITGLANFASIFTPFLDLMSGSFSPITGLANLVTGLISGGLLGGSSPLNGFNLFGGLPSSLMSLIPISSLGQTSPNLLVNPGFDTAASLDGAGVWLWDGTVGHTAPNGTAKVVATGANKELSSNVMAVTANHTFNFSAWVQWNALVATGNPIQIALTSYLNGSAVSQTIIASTGSGLSGSGWRQLTGSYTVPAGVDAVRLRTVVTSAATAGTIWFDDLFAGKTQSIPTSFLTDLTRGLPLDSVLASFESSITSLLTQILNTVGLGTFNSLLTSLAGGSGGFTSIENRLLSFLNGSSTVNAGQIGGTGSIASDFIPDLTSTRDNIVNQFLGFIGTGWGNTDVSNALGAHAQAVQGLAAQVAVLNNTFSSGITFGDDFEYAAGVMNSNWTVTYSGSGGTVRTDGHYMYFSPSGTSDRFYTARWNANQTSTDYQLVQAVFGSAPQTPGILPPGNPAFNRVCSRLNAANTDMVYAEWGNGLCKLVRVVSNIETTLNSVGWPTPASGSTMAIQAGKPGVGARIFIPTINGQQCMGEFSEVGTASMVDASHRFTGVGGHAGSWLLSLTQSAPGKLNQFVGGDR